MGIGMQIVYLGFCGTKQLESEAAAQLVRLDRYSALVSNYHLAIEAIRSQSGTPTYDVRLDLITPANDLEPIGHCSGENAEEAIRRAFDVAEKELHMVAEAARLRRH
ncbi:hypothetical protein [Paraburkholderia diazotrophica]|uniref:Sigma 54 modulation protein / S30EA ribosomal protein n=1 Tax=Paraburkholderia diazotrophica TaxID=667676 RepID=A0A1H7EA66_9BURK|nr:hypothetical protein [Paraburkholderia diazotrophica]SEK10806.1 hypothetical protein SAMN05192539_104916 [Paraburkholderia diazotrophica]